ncbi:unnamed protein product [Amoebophrya sp. A120]|nr:unnamed protein product [Amoebophrya sp. A120]|eukprot:GSA120T00018740001.1
MKDRQWKLLPMAMAFLAFAYYKAVPEELRHGIYYFLTTYPHPHPLATNGENRFYGLLSGEDLYKVPRKMIDKDVLFVVTGASSGIGFALAVELLDLGLEKQLVFAVRNTKKMEQLLADQYNNKTREAPSSLDADEHQYQSATSTTIDLSTSTSRAGVPKPHILPLDLSSLKAVKEADEKIRELAKESKKAVVLVNNAGIGWMEKKEITKDGFELQFQTNHLSPFLLTRLLLKEDEKKNQKKVLRRVIHVSSLLHAFGKLPGFKSKKKSALATALEDGLSGKMVKNKKNSTDSTQEQQILAKKKPTNKTASTSLNITKLGLDFHWNTYSNTKLMNNLFSNSLVRKLDVHSVSVHPGMVYTGSLAENAIGNFFGKVVQPLSNWLFMDVIFSDKGRNNVKASYYNTAGVFQHYSLRFIGMITAKEAAVNQILYAMFELRPIIGEHYVGDSKLATQSRLAQDEEMMDYLWESSEKMLERWL